MQINFLKDRYGRLARTTVTVGLFAGLALVATGCGPGFPIMTNEQELLVNNVKTLMKENAKLKERVKDIEESGASGAELEDTRLSLADIKSEMGRMRDEFSFIRGSFDEDEIAISQLRADIEGINEKLDTLSARLAEATASLEDANGQLTSLAADKLVYDTGRTELGSAVEELKGRLGTLEESVKRLREGRTKGATKKSGAVKAAVSKKRTAPKELYSKGLKELRDKEYSKASKTFKTFLATHPKDDLADNAQYWLGEIFYDTGEYERAILEFDKVITGYPKGDKRAAATLKQGFSFINIGALKEARVLLETVIELYPKSEEALKARKRLDSMKK